MKYKYKPKVISKLYDMFEWYPHTYPISKFCLSPKYLELYVLIFLQVLPAKSIDIFQTFDETTLKY